MKQIFPKEIIDNTFEVHQFKHSSKSKVIYTLILVFIITILTLLPFIKVDIYTTARGIIKPDKERLTVNTINSGKVVVSHLKNNAFVSKGDTLLVIDNAIINEKLQLSIQQIETISIFIEDLKYLIQTKYLQLNNITSPKYKKEYLAYNQKKLELETKYKKIQKDFTRSKLLYEKEIIAKVEFENAKLEYDLVVNNIYQLKQQQISPWQATLTEYQNNLLELKSTNNQLLTNKSQLVIEAPITGTLLNVKSIENGSFISAGEVFATISPHTNLLVECFISPLEIGLLKIGAEANFQIDAYNYNQWGLASGKITDISNDIEFIENTSGFKVICQLNEQQLALKNGFASKLKKGMTLNARFKLAERSVFDLLYDRVDDWLNPSKNQLTAKNTPN